MNSNRTHLWVVRPFGEQPSPSDGGHAFGVFTSWVSADREAAERNFKYEYVEVVRFVEAPRAPPIVVE